MSNKRKTKSKTKGNNGAFGNKKKTTTMSIAGFYYDHNQQGGEAIIVADERLLAMPSSFHWSKLGILGNNLKEVVDNIIAMGEFQYNGLLSIMTPTEALNTLHADLNKISDLWTEQGGLNSQEVGQWMAYVNILTKHKRIIQDEHNGTQFQYDNRFGS